ncbi:Hypothetical predicted protein [Lecanosticta acicola]|uniref:Uncharacterized protein n=1 Tax=Lecanosticta acicola TaxID=111012 RepID=A0AAI9E7Y7_9PEZI|nr:Hypothetical predicted protein [Lecanosticta acicola]
MGGKPSYIDLLSDSEDDDMDQPLTSHSPLLDQIWNSLTTSRVSPGESEFETPRHVPPRSESPLFVAPESRPSRNQKPSEKEADKPSRDLRAVHGSDEDEDGDIQLEDEEADFESPNFTTSPGRSPATVAREEVTRQPSDSPPPRPSFKRGPSSIQKPRLPLSSSKEATMNYNARFQTPEAGRAPGAFPPSTPASSSSVLLHQKFQTPQSSFRNGASAAGYTSPFFPPTQNPTPTPSAKKRKLEGRTEVDLSLPTRGNPLPFPPQRPVPSHEPPSLLSGMPKRPTKDSQLLTSDPETDHLGASTLSTPTPVRQQPQQPQPQQQQQQQQQRPIGPFGANARGKLRGPLAPPISLRAPPSNEEVHSALSEVQTLLENYKGQYIDVMRNLGTRVKHLESKVADLEGENTRLTKEVEEAREEVKRMQDVGSGVNGGGHGGT